MPSFPQTDGETPRLRRSLAWNYIGYFFKILVNLGLTSYLAHRVAPEEYGLFLFVMAVSATLYLLDLGISYFLVQSYVEALTGTSEKVGNLLWTVFLAFAALGTLGLILMIGLALALPGPFDIPHSQIHEAAVIFVIAGIIIQVGFSSIALEQFCQAAHRFDTLNAVQMTGVVTTFVLSVVAIQEGLGIIGLAAAQLIAVLLQLLLLSVQMRALLVSAGFERLPRPKFDWGVLSDLLRRSKWAFIHNLSLYGSDLLMWVIITSFTSMKDAALFGVASKLPRQLWNLVDRGANVLLPVLSKSALEKDTEGLRTTVYVALKLVVGALIPFVVLGCLFSGPILRLWAGDVYADAAPAMRWLLIASFAQGVGYPSDELLYVLGKAGKSAQISIWTGVLGNAAALLLVFHYGIAGVTAGMAIVRLVTNCWWFTRESTRLTKSSMRDLIRFVSEGLVIPTAVLVLAGLALAHVANRMSSIWIVGSAIMLGTLTLGIWTYRTALPYLKTQARLSA